MTNPEGIEPPFTTTASSSEHHLAYGKDFFYENTKYMPHSPYSASKASSDHFVRAFHDTYGMPTIVTNCSNNYGPYQFPEKLIPDNRNITAKNFFKYVINSSLLYFTNITLISDIQ